MVQQMFRGISAEPGSKVNTAFFLKKRFFKALQGWMDYKQKEVFDKRIIKYGLLCDSCKRKLDLTA